METVQDSGSFSQVYLVYYLGRLSSSWDFRVGQKSLVLGRGISHNCYINVFLYILPVSYEMNANLRERILFCCSYCGDGTRSLQRCPLFCEFMLLNSHNLFSTTFVNTCRFNCCIYFCFYHKKKIINP